MKWQQVFTEGKLLFIKRQARREHGIESSLGEHSLSNILIHAFSEVHSFWNFLSTQ